jgi:uncharacterized protein (TIGR03546 family)
MLNPLKYIRKIARIFRGGSTPVEIGAAVTLGMVLGMTPGFSLLAVALILLVILLNVPVRLVLLSLMIGKALSVPLAAVTFLIGKTLLAIGPVESLVRLLVNAPVTAWMDFDRYCTLGGLLLGTVLGVGLSVLLRYLIQSFRMKMARIEADSERFHKYSRNAGVRFAAWLLLGKGMKKGVTYADVLDKRTRIFRKSGVIVAVIALALILCFEFLFAGYILRGALVHRLEQVNGATVDIEGVDLSLFQGRCTLKGIQVCDPDHLDRNLVSIREAGFDFGVADLLSRRFVIDELRIIDAETETLRKKKGARTYKEKPLPEPPPPEEGIPQDSKTIYDYLEEAKRWKERIERLYRFYRRIRPKDKPEPGEEEIDRVGYKDLRASYLVEERPLLLIRKITVGGLVINTEAGRTKLDLAGTNFSTNARLAGVNPKLAFSTRGKDLAGSITFSLMDASRPHLVNFKAKNANLGDIQRILSKKNRVTFESGTADLSIISGEVAPGKINLPVQVKLHGVEARCGKEGFLGLNPETSKELVEVLNDLDTVLVIKGRPYAPYVVFDTAALMKSFKEAALKAGKRGISDLIDKKIGDRVGDGLPVFPFPHRD